MTIRVVLAIVFAFSIVLLTGCVAPAPPPPPDMPLWTVMVYVDGDNNLESAALDDFYEMAAVGSTESVNIVAQIDRVPGHTSLEGNWTDTRRFFITEDSKLTDEPLENLGEVNMGDPATLEDFVAWAVTNYPAEHYLLSIWNHGDGWRDMMDRMAAEADTRSGTGNPDTGITRAIASDDTDGHDKLYMHEVAEALNNAQSETETKLDVVGFDACLMGLVEVAYEMRNNADYMIASEMTEPGDGWPYDLFLDELVSAPTMLPAELAESIVTNYVASYPNGGRITQAATDLAQIEDLVTAIDEFTSIADEWAALRAARGSMAPYTDPVYHVANCHNSCWGVDLVEFTDRLLAEEISEPLQNAATALKGVVDNFVIAAGHSSDMDGSHGVAIYFPESLAMFNADPDHTGYEQDNTFMPVAFVEDHEWDEWLQRFYAGGPEPLLYLPFDGDVLDHSDSSLSTTATGNIGFVAGIRGQAAEIDGSGEAIDVTGVAGLPFTDELTLEFWVNMDNWSNPYSGSPPLESIAHLGTAYGMAVWSNSWNLEAHLTTDQTGSSYITLSGGQLQPEQWHHVALVYQGKDGKAYLYLDGVQVAEQTVSGLIPPDNPNSFRIGTWYQQNQAFSGLVDELRLYNVGLDADTIHRLAQR